MKFKEGDKVRLREDLIVNKEYLGIRLLRGMIFLGAKPINFVYDNIRVDINGFIYTVDMLELVESTKKEVIPVLDDVEKKYLENTLKPYKVINVVKYNCSGGFQFIYAWIMGVNNDCEKISFPYFKKDTKYKGMKPNRLYTPKELGLFVKEENQQAKAYKITLTEFFDSKDVIAIHCDNFKKAKVLSKAFDKLGKTWADGERYINYCYYPYYENTVYYNDGRVGNLEYAEEKNYKVYEFEDVNLEKLKSGIYQEYKIIGNEKEKDYKFKVGDEVRAINDEYIITSKKYEWEGIVIFASDNEFSAKTTHSTISDIGKGEVFYNLDYSCFEKVEA